MDQFFKGYPKRRKQDDFRLSLLMILMVGIFTLFACDIFPKSWEMSTNHPFKWEYSEWSLRWLQEHFDLRSEESRLDLPEKYKLVRRYILENRQNEAGTVFSFKKALHQLNFRQIESSKIKGKGCNVTAKRDDQWIWVDLLYSNPIIGTIVLVIDDFGYRMDETTEKFLNIQTPMTYAVIPGNEFTKEVAGKLAAKGKEIIVHMPMEPYSATTDDEKHVLKTDDAHGNWRKLLKSAWSEVPGAIGMNNHQGSKATENPELMRVVMDFVKSKNAFFVDSRTSSKTLGEKIAKKQGVPTVAKTLFLDDPEDEISIREKFEKLAEMAKHKDFILAIGHEKPVTLSILKEEIPKLQAQGFVFVPVSEVVK